MANPHETGRSVVVDPTSLHLGDCYDYLDREGVVGFLAEHPHLLPILRDAEPEIALRFGERTRVTLELIDDEELNDEPFVMGAIRATLPAREFVTRLHQMDAEWWTPRSAAAKNHLLFTFG